MMILLSRTLKLFALSTGLSIALLTSAQAIPENYVEKTIEVSETSLIADVARSHGLAAEHLAWANGLSPTTRVKAGQSLQLPLRLVPENRPSDGVVVNLAERGFYLFQDDEYQGFYPISVGMQSKESYETPTGNFELISRVKNPEWNAPDSDWAEAMEKDTIDADSKDNPLGEYWFGFNAPQGGLGFHENTAPSYTGDDVSHGCMRLNPKDAAYLFENKLLTPGDTVKIVNQPIRVTELQSGDPKMVVFPGLYDEDASLEQAEKILTEAGIWELVSKDYLKTRLSEKSGVPFDVLDGGIAIQDSSGSKAAEGYLVDGHLVVPSDLAREVGLEVNYRASKDLIEVSSDDTEVSFRLGESSESPRAYRLGDSTYVQARELLEPFNINFRWDSENRILKIGQQS